MTWFVYSPYEQEISFYQTEEAAKKAFEEAIEEYRKESILDGEWDKAVEEVCMGRVTHEVELLPVVPDDLADRIECGMASEGDEFAEAYVKEA
jgi:hypothetical protein